MQEELTTDASCGTSDIKSALSASPERNEVAEPDADDVPFVRDYLEYLLKVEEQMRKSLVEAQLAAGAPLDSTMEPSMDSPRIHPDLVRRSIERIRNLPPEIRLPHGLAGTRIFGIPIPPWTQIDIVNPESEVDAWNSYYCVEHPDVEPYAAGLTCVPRYDDPMDHHEPEHS